MMVPLPLNGQCQDMDGCLHLAVRSYTLPLLAWNLFCWEGLHLLLPPVLTTHWIAGGVFFADNKFVGKGNTGQG